MKETFAFCVGAILMGITTAALLNGHITKGDQAYDLIKECQKDLRRDEYCTIIAVPADEIEED